MHSCCAWNGQDPFTHPSSSCWPLYRLQWRNRNYGLKQRRLPARIAGKHQHTSSSYCLRNGQNHILQTRKWSIIVGKSSFNQPPTLSKLFELLILNILQLNLEILQFFTSWQFYFRQPARMTQETCDVLQSEYTVTGLYAAISNAFDRAGH
jgi:hypothetical protein